MPIYKVTSKTRTGYDEYEGFVVRASSPEKAVEFVRNISYNSETAKAIGWERKLHGEMDRWTDENVVVEHIPPRGKSRIILDAFRAG